MFKTNMTEAFEGSYLFDMSKKRKYSRDDFGMQNMQSHRY